jgi:hypothetical protein
LLTAAATAAAGWLLEGLEGLDEPPPDELGDCDDDESLLVWDDVVRQPASAVAATRATAAGFSLGLSS